MHDKHKNEDSNRFFVGDVSHALWRSNSSPKVIVHGHTHEAADYNLAGIRVVCNPFGYPFEGRTKINPKLVEW